MRGGPAALTGDKKLLFILEALIRPGVKFGILPSPIRSGSDSS